MADQYIWVVTDTAPVNQDSPTPLKGDRANNALPNPFNNNTPSPSPPPSPKRPGIPVPVEKMEQGIADFLDTMGRVLQKAQAKAQEIGSMELDEIELSVEVNGEGQLSLLGSGTKVGGSGALTLKFKRKSANDIPENSPSEQN